MATFVPAILPALDQLRSIADFLGKRVYTVTLTVRTWTGERPGVFGSTHTDVTFPLVNTDYLGNTHPVGVKQLSRRDIVASGGLYSEQSLKVGALTPTYTVPYTGGVSTDQLDPPTTANATEVFWLVTGPGLPSSGAWYEKVGEEATSLHYYVFLNRSARKP